MTANRAFISHLARYVGVGLISGSIVHAGTLGGSGIRYVVLILVGIIAFGVGTYLENRDQKIKNISKYISMSIIISVGTGMVSGGTQHYLDGPYFAAGLISIGLLIAYISFNYRDFRSKLTLKQIVLAIIISLALGTGLYFVARYVPVTSDHHEDSEIHTN